MEQYMEYIIHSIYYHGMCDNMGNKGVGYGDMHEAGYEAIFGISYEPIYEIDYG